MHWASSAAGDNTVSFGTSPGSLSSTVTATATAYTAFKYTSPSLKHALLTGLKPGTKYYYTVGGSACGTSAVMNFKSNPGACVRVIVKRARRCRVAMWRWAVSARLPTSTAARRVRVPPLAVPHTRVMSTSGICALACSSSPCHLKTIPMLILPTRHLTRPTSPAPAGPGVPMTWGLIGDLGQTSNSADTLAHVDASPSIDAVIHVGDISYADSVETRWDSWGTLVQATTSHTPWNVQVGNHEVESDGSKQFEAYNARFWGPATQARGPSNGTWYSISGGLAHWVMVSGYETFTKGSPQYAWLQADLAAVDRTATPFLFVAYHQPAYNSNTAHQGEGEALRQSLEPLFYAAGVDAIFSGHVHAYERSIRQYNNKPDASGPYYITIGDGGNREGLAANWINPQPAWSVFRQASYGHGAWRAAPRGRGPGMFLASAVPTPTPTPPHLPSPPATPSPSPTRPPAHPQASWRW